MRKISKAVLNPLDSDYMDLRPRCIPGATITSWNGTPEIDLSQLFAKPGNGPTVTGSTAGTAGSGARHAVGRSRDHLRNSGPFANDRNRLSSVRATLGNRCVGRMARRAGLVAFAGSAAHASIFSELLMSKDLYDLKRIVERAREWRVQAEAAAIPDVREFCLREARLCEQVVQRSLLTPPLAETGPDGASIPFGNGYGMGPLRGKPDEV